MKALNRAVYIFTVALPIALLCVTGGGFLLPVLLAVVLHEAAHIVALRLLGGKLLSLKVAPFGLCIDFREDSLSLAGELLVALSGCAANLVFTALSLVLYRFFGVDIIAYGSASLCLAIINFIPVYQLDGGKLLNIAISAIFGPFAAARTLYITSHIICFLLFSVTSYMFVTSVCSVYPLLFSVYLAALNFKMQEKTYIYEKQSI